MVTKDDPQVTQDDPRVTQHDPWVTHNDQRVTQDDPRVTLSIRLHRVTQDDPRVTLRLHRVTPGLFLLAPPERSTGWLDHGFYVNSVAHEWLPLYSAKYKNIDQKL